jgi:hypothetical protein
MEALFLLRTLRGIMILNKTYVVMVDASPEAFAANKRVSRVW